MQSLLHEIVDARLELSCHDERRGGFSTAWRPLLGLRTHTHFEGQAAMDVDSAPMPPTAKARR